VQLLAVLHSDWCARCAPAYVTPPCFCFCRVCVLPALCFDSTYHCLFGSVRLYHDEMDWMDGMGWCIWWRYRWDGVGSAVGLWGIRMYLGRMECLGWMEGWMDGWMSWTRCEAGY